MAYKVGNRIKMTVAAAPGQNSIQLGSAVTGFRSFTDEGIQTNDTVPYIIEDGQNWELGVGTYTASGTTLARTSVTSSSAGGTTKINATISAVVMVAPLAADLTNLFALSISSGKTFTVANSLTLSGTDSSTLNIGAGGALGTSAFVDAGTSANNIVQLNGSAYLPALNASLLTNLNGSNISTGTVDYARLPVGTTTSTLAAGDDSRITGAAQKSSNLSDLTSANTARANLGLVIGTDVQAYDADLGAIAALAGTTGLLKKTAANTWTLDTSTYLTGITSGNVTTALGFTPENAANKGVASGYAGLDGTGKVPAAQLPSYVDDVLEYTNLAGFPGTGSTGVIYVALDTNKIYRWTGSAYVEISPSPGSTDSVTEGSTNLYFTTARARSSISATGSLSYNSSTGVISYTESVSSVAGRTGTVTLTKSDVGLSSVENTALSTWAGSANITTLGTIATGTWSATAIAVAKGGTGATDAATARSNLGLAIGSNVQAWDGDLDAIAALAGTSGILKKTAANTWTLDTSTYLTGSISLTSGVSGTLPVGNGGTGATTLTGILKGNGASAFTAATANTDYLAPALANTAVSGFKTATFNSQTTIASTSGSITVDWTSAQNQKQTEPVGTITYTFTAPPGPCHLQLIIDSDGTSTAQTFNWPGTVVWMGTTWAAAANKKAVINFWYDGSSYFAVGTNQV